MAAIRFAPRAATWLIALFALVIATALDAQAQSDDALPTRVGRIANVQGPLRHSPETGDVWSTVGLNYPVAQGDNLWTASDARAEVDYGGGEFRLAGDTNVHVSRLDERQLALFVASGRLIVRVRYLEPGDSIRVDTAATQLALARPGLYRVDVDSDAQRTKLTVREGEADMGSVSGITRVFPGQVAMIATHDATADVRNGGGLDGFDTWSAERDRVYESPRANEYVSREMVGAPDFDRYGEWQTYPEYGAVWFPTVDPEWAPYRFGYWTWLTGFGYTWVDDAAWGYAPFHYGRWIHVGNRWGWCPGRFVARPAWAPALVAWYGSGPGAGGAHVVGWVPLGWSDAYMPSWRCSARCYARYNRPYAIEAARPDPRPARYANAGVPNAITTVPAATLTTERPVARNRVPVPTDRSAAPPLVAAPPTLPPAPPKPGAVHPGNGAPLPAGAYAGRVAPSAPLDPPAMSSTLPAPPRSPLVAVPAGGSSSPTPASSTVRPVPVPPPAPPPAPPPVRVAPPALPLPRAPSAPVPGTLPVPPAAVVPMPVHPVPPVPTPAPGPAPAVVPQPSPLPAPVAPARPASSTN